MKSNRVCLLIAARFSTLVVASIATTAQLNAAGVGPASSQPEAPNLLAAVPGNYTGLITNAPGMAWDRSGFFNLKIRSSGAYSGRVTLAEGAYAVSGIFDSMLEATNRITRPRADALLVVWQLAGGLESIAGAVSSANFTSILSGWRAGFSAGARPTNFLGQ